MNNHLGSLTFKGNKKDRIKILEEEIFIQSMRISKLKKFISIYLQPKKKIENEIFIEELEKI